ncbi:MAG TPA: SEL1-like repeat protein, partial [Gammaproteobacteria bacterium]|nr:SEL1-like repeat protein [Gammaproteobacteria bacterium]
MYRSQLASRATTFFAAGLLAIGVIAARPTGAAAATAPAAATAASPASMAALRALAEKGNAEAQYALGVSYGRGQRVKQDYAEAAQWFTKA